MSKSICCYSSVSKGALQYLQRSYLCRGSPAEVQVTAFTELAEPATVAHSQVILLKIFSGRAKLPLPGISPDTSILPVCSWNKYLGCIFHVKIQPLQHKTFFEIEEARLSWKNYKPFYNKEKNNPNNQYNIICLSIHRQICHI